MTVKSYFNVVNLLIYAVALLPLTIMSANITSGIGIGIMISTISMSYPFAIGEKSSMDALYPTLSLKRESVVAGRYLFALALNICAVLFAVTLALLGLLVTGMLGLAKPTGNEIWGFLPLAAMFVTIQPILLSLFFKFGYTKARFFVVIPFAVIAAFCFALVIVMSSGNLPEGVSVLLTKLMASDISLVLFSVVIFPLLVFASYRLSLSFYRKREF
jgi:hypothetical protein